MLLPVIHSICRPTCGLVLVAGCTWVGNFVFVGLGRRDEPEGMGMHKCAGDAFAFDFRHVTGDALAAGAACFVMRVLFQGSRVRTVGGGRAVTVEAKLTSWLSQLGRI